MTQHGSQIEQSHQPSSAHAAWKERLKELEAEGLTRRVEELHSHYRHGEISFGRLAEELELNVWELTHLLDEMGLPATNLPSSDE